MPTPSRLLVPFLTALLIGASAPAFAEETVTADPVVDATVEPSAEPTPEAEPAEEPTTNPEPTAEPTAEPEVEPTTQATPAPEPEVEPTAAPQQARRAVVEAPSTVTTATELTDALAACETGDTITLGADITTSSTLAVPCDLTLDLAGRALRAFGIEIGIGRHLRIDDSATGGSIVTSRTGSNEAGIRSTDAQLTIDGGTITATGGHAGAGIGGGLNDGRNGGNGGTIVINGGTITATGGSWAAGIGGAGWGAGGTIAINGGTITATGGEFGAGIGSGYNRGFTSISITGGTVDARAGSEASAIGAARDGYFGGSPIAIGAGAHVSVTAGSSSSAVGLPLAGYNVGPLTVDGTLHVASGHLDATTFSSFRIGATGAVLGSEATPADGPAIIGSGRIDNEGVLVAGSLAEGVRVAGHHYRLTFAGADELQPLTVMAPTVEDGLAALPEPSKTGLSFAGWQRDGEPFDATTSLGDGTADGMPVTVALTARWVVRTTTDLGTALGTCPDETIALGADLTVGSSVNVACDVTLDLAGHDLTVAGLTIDADQTLTIDDSEGDGTLVSTSPDTAGIRTTGAALVIDGGTVRATGGSNAAGIGGGMSQSGGTTTINDGTVEAVGRGVGSAGIGGGHSGGGGTIVINGGVIDARSSFDGAAIGGGTSGSVGLVTINGGDVTATTSEGVGSGIGGAWMSQGGTVRITGGTVTSTAADGGAGIGSGRNATGATSVEVLGGTVSATGGRWAPGLGSGQSTSAASNVEIGAGADVTSIGGSGAATVIGHPESGARGEVTIDGVVRVPSGTIDVSRNDLTIGATGRLVGTTADPTVGASITGDGTIANGGVIALTDVAESVEVTGHHYDVVASTDTVTVYGPSVQGGFRTLPAEPTRGIDVFTGWSLGGDAFTAATTLPGSSTDGSAVRVELEATWDEGVAAFDIGDSVTLVPNAEPTTVTLSLTDGGGDPVGVDPAAWDVSVPEGVELEHDGEAWRLRSTAPGSGTVTASVEQGSRTYTATLEVTSRTGAVDSMTLTRTGDATEGGTITVTATGADASGNDLGDVTEDVTFTSSVATDVIEGNEITFPHASPHTITATHANGTTATLVVEVEPAAESPVDETPVDETPVDETPVDDETDADDPLEEQETSQDAAKKESALARTGGSMSAWWLASGLGMLVAGGLLVGRVRRR
ncbi:LPXTG cell wall anchor domain-containing protein [Aeromicrobium sp. JJY06]|uniref:LPXTG cell wall anchor domain-containing protein n=1 Tax=Aeromicrobium sp. JJY06 TaxID=3373478 RepID=UPI00376EB392